MKTIKSCFAGKPFHHISSVNRLIGCSVIKFFLVLFTFSFFLFTSTTNTFALPGDTPIGCLCSNSQSKLTPCCTRCSFDKPIDAKSHGCYSSNPSSSTSPAPVDTTTTTTSTPLGPIEGLGPLGTVIRFLSPNDVSPASDRLASVLSMVIGVITIVTGLWFTIRILIAGFTIISAGGDKNKMQESQHMITNSVIGLTVAVAAYALASLFSKILGINFLNITEALINLNK